uniref:Signal peptidase complex subunit 3 n=1 Tax=Romanomermis culicivorax TaxID=13658 RepID=A0A915IDQ6_ROMCU
MHSFLSRLNAVFAFALSVLASVTFACFVTTFFKNYSTAVEIATAKPFIKNLPDYSANREKNDLAVLNFDLQVDLSPLFDWNTKQLFLFLTAEYATKENALNQVVLWDKIVLRTDNPVIDLKSNNLKYYFWDDGNGLR